MKDETILELAAKWDRVANKDDGPQDGSPSAAVSNAMETGFRNALRGCAVDLRTLVKLLGGTAND